MIVDYIESHRDRFGVEPICAVLTEHGVLIAPSTFYARRAQRVTDAQLTDAYLANALFTLWAENWRVYGARKLWKAARRAHLDIGRDQVARLMRIAGISGAVRGQHRTVTTRRNDKAPGTPTSSGVAGTPPPRPTSYGSRTSPTCGTLAGFVYVAFVVDVYSRRCLGWRVSTSKQTSLVTDALRQALQVRHRDPEVTGWTGNGLIHHSDAGSQYTSVAFTAELLEAGIAGSIGSVGDALDNALCESAIGLFKTEAIYDGGPTWADRSAVEWQVARWVHWYNNTRLHSSIDYLPPIEFEQLHRQATKTTPDPEVA